MSRSIGIFTGNRAEYGLQFPILRAVANHTELSHQLYVSGAHLDSNFGRTVDEIKKDGFDITKEININTDGASLYSTVQAIGSGIKAIAETLSEKKPDIFVVYADRFEGFSAVVAATQLGIPTAHVEGGDLTEGGALDDSVRHAMTKLSHLHFTTNEQATNRILAMGEERWRVHTVGLPTLDLISEKQYANPLEVLNRLNLSKDKPIVLFTFHSVSSFFEEAGNEMKQCLIALKNLAFNGVQVVLTYPNNDAGSSKIVEHLKEFQIAKVPNTQVHLSLGRHLYHGLLSLAKEPGFRVACAGNSSSGLKETPAFFCPTVNIGSRQNGRLRGQNVIDAKSDAPLIESAILRCLYDEEFRDHCHKASNPYWQGKVGPKIAKILAEIDINDELIRKRMTLNGNVKDGWYN